MICYSTGADLGSTVLWKITPLFADWISSPAPYAFLPTPSTILELGCGISPLNALALALNPTTTRCVLTDQPYVQKLVARNIEENEHHLLLSQQQQQRREGGRSRRNRGGGKTIAAAGPASIEFQPLDWETDSAGGAAAGIEDGFDLVLACDCVYNEALIEPLVQTCAEACALRTSPAARDPTGERDGALHPTVCMVAQQLRDNTVFESWLTAFQGRFVTWRVPDDDLPEGLRPDDGFVIYAGILRSQAEI